MVLVLRLLPTDILRPLVLDNKAKAVYSTTQYNTTDPVWVDLPEVRFRAGLKVQGVSSLLIQQEILHESIVLHVTHNGKMHNTTLGRCNVLGYLSLLIS